MQRIAGSTPLALRARACRRARKVYVRTAEQKHHLYRSVPEAMCTMTAALPDCLTQTIWMANAWLMPEQRRVSS